MGYDYDTLYGETRDALGAPTAVFIDFFDRFERHNARILDVGCGQGRDAVMVARKGHSVVGVDISPNGIRDLMSVAEAENLRIEGVVGDIASYVPAGMFDVILIDRTLHMLARAARLEVLSGLLGHVSAGGWLLIADERANMADIQTVISAHTLDWKVEFNNGGYLFVKRP